MHYNGNYNILDKDNLPLLLKEIPNSPAKLFYRGDIECLKGSELKIAIVGTRKAGAYGLDMARKLTGDLARGGAVVVSGLALGIDQVAHRGCLEAGGVTVAVLGSGLDEIYPRQHYSLAKNIIDSGGAVISEYEGGSPSLSYRFLERNRIISGLCHGVVVIEAPFASGSLNTASHAIEQNREVFVVPGMVSSNNYAGSHKLIKQGAGLITNAKDIFDSFGVEYKERKRNRSLSFLTEEQKMIFAVLCSAGVSLTTDEIAEKVNLEAGIVSQNLTNLLLEDFVKEDGGKYFNV